MKSKKIKKKSSRRLRGHPQPKGIEDEEEMFSLGGEYDADFIETDELETFNPDLDETDESEW